MKIRSENVPVLKKLIPAIGTIVFFFLVSIVDAAVSPVQSGNWNDPATWGGSVPLVTDDVLINGGFTVTLTSDETAFSLEVNAGTLITNSGQNLIVNGSLTVQNATMTVNGTNITVNGSVFVGKAAGSDVGILELNTGTAFTTTGNFRVEYTGSTVTIQDGAELYVNGDVVSDSSVGMDFYNSGFVEIDGSLNCATLDVTNYETGVLLIHTNILGSTATYSLDNYGVITVDNNVTLDKVNFINYSTGKFLVYGNITIINSSTFKNAGLIQCNVYTHSGSEPFENFDCELLTGTVSATTASTTVTGTGTAFLSELAVGDVITYGSCNAMGTVASVTSDTELELTNNSYLTNNDVFYISVPGTVIALEDFVSDFCLGCQNFNQTGNIYYGNLSIPVGAASWCNAPTPSIHCDTWFADQVNVKPIIPGRRLWLASDFLGYGSGNDGDRVYRWFDLANSFGFFMAQPSGNNMPILKNNATDNLNYNPVMSFDEIDANYLSMDLDNNPLYAFSADGGMAMFAVVVPKNEAGGGGDQFVFDYGLYSGNGYGLMYSDQSAKAYTATNAGGVENSNAHVRGAKPTLVAQTATWGGNQVLSIDGATLQSLPIAGLSQLEATEVAHAGVASATTGPLTLGINSTTLVSNDFDGHLAELIIYANDISVGTKNAAEAFLAIKYGITLGHDYLANDELTTIYSLDGTYENCIAGIGREDLNLLHQKQSKSIETDAVLTIATEAPGAYDQSEIATRITNNTSYLIWGHDGNATPLNRIYKVTSTNFSQNVTLQFEIAGLDAGNLPVLLVAGDDTFSANLSQKTATGYVGDLLTFTYTFTNNTTSYFRFLQPAVVFAPGVAIDSTDVDSTAQLHVVSQTKGVLITKMTTANMNSIASPANGLLIYNTDLESFMYNEGTAGAPVWKIVGTPSSNTAAELGAAGGSYLGELRFNSDNNLMYFWDGTSWQQIVNTGNLDPTP